MPEEVFQVMEAPIKRTGGISENPVEYPCLEGILGGDQQLRSETNLFICYGQFV